MHVQHKKNDLENNLTNIDSSRS